MKHSLSMFFCLLFPKKRALFEKNTDLAAKARAGPKLHRRIGREQITPCRFYASNAPESLFPRRSADVAEHPKRAAEEPVALRRKLPPSRRQVPATAPSGREPESGRFVKRPYGGRTPHPSSASREIGGCHLPLKGKAEAGSPSHPACRRSPTVRPFRQGGLFLAQIT